MGNGICVLPGGLPIHLLWQLHPRPAADKSASWEEDWEATDSRTVSDWRISNLIPES